MMLRRPLPLLILTLLLCLAAHVAAAQTTVQLCVIPSIGSPQCPQVTAANPLPVTGSITANNASVGLTGAAVPTSATYIGINIGGNLVAPVGGHGTAAGALRVELPTDGTGVVGLNAGSAIIGNVRIDQTTPGTTNGVQVNAALPAGTNVIGAVRIDQTTPGTTNGVQVNAALPAGTNVIGAVGNTIASTTSGQSGPLVQCGATTAAPSYTTAQTDPLSCDLTGQLRTRDVASTATGSAVSASAAYIGANVGGNNTGMVACNLVAQYDASTNGATQLVALASTQIIRVCGYVVFSAGTVNVSLIYGTGSNCVTGPNPVTPAFQLTAQTGVADASPFWRGLATIASNELCLKTSAGVAVQALVYYTQY